MDTHSEGIYPSFFDAFVFEEAAMTEAVHVQEKLNIILLSEGRNEQKKESEALRRCPLIL